MKTVAICPECGESRRGVTDYCSVCGWNPYDGDLQMARSLYFSSRRFDDGDSAAAKRWNSELRSIGERIRAGGEAPVDAAELKRLTARAGQEFPPPRAPVLGLLLVGLGFFAIAGGVLWLCFLMVRG